MTARALIYVRQSETKGAGKESLSLASQEAVLRQVAAQKGAVVVGVEIEADIRGWVEDHEREAWPRVMDRARRGEFDVLIVFELSRLARKLVIQEQIIDQLAACGVDYYSHTEPFASDPLFRQLLGMLHEHRTREISAHVKRSYAERNRRGIAHSHTPYGYWRATRRDRFVPDPDRAPVVRRVFALALDGMLVAEIAHLLNREGVEGPAGAWGWQTVRGLIANPAYRGAVATSGVCTEHAHEPIVDAADWERANALVGARDRPRVRAKPVRSFVDGLVWHDCGERGYLVRRTGQADGVRCSSIRWHGQGKAVPHCGLYPQCARLPDIEAFAWQAVTTALARLVDPESAIRRANEIAARDAPEAHRRRRDLAAQLARADDRWQRAEALYLDGARDRAWLSGVEGTLALERVRLQAALDELPPEPDGQAIRDAARILRSLDDPDALAAATVDERRALVFRLGVTTFGPAGLRFWFWPWVAPLVDGPSTDDWLRDAQAQRPCSSRPS